MNRAVAEDAGRTTPTQCQKVLFSICLVPGIVLGPSAVNTHLVHGPKIQAARERSGCIKEQSNQTHNSKWLAFRVGAHLSPKTTAVVASREGVNRHDGGMLYSGVLLECCISPMG